MVSAADKKAKRAKSWKGSKQAGPAPARHIPWPEVFKHHLSIIEGHLRMLEMIQKHTVPDSGNWHTITPMVERAREMAQEHKMATRTFAPSTDTFAAVPLGSSSASMYPGYSPKDHEYGKASMEAGQAFAEAKKRGLELPQDPKAPSFVVGQAHGAKRRMMFQDKGDQKDGQQQNGTEGAPKADAADDGEEEATSAAAEDGNPYFVIDTDPTPVDIPKDKTSKKRSSADRSPREPPTKKSKKAKTETSQEGQEPKVEFEDISAEVDERLKAKEAKRKAREEKKRRRESGESAVAESTEATVGTEKPKKKAKKENGGKESKKRSKSVDTDEPAAEEESFKKKHKKEKIATGAE